MGRRPTPCAAALTYQVGINAGQADGAFRIKIRADYFLCASSPITASFLEPSDNIVVWCRGDCSSNCPFNCEKMKSSLVFDQISCSSNCLLSPSESSDAHVLYKAIWG